jgi:hypothetical protein
MYSENEIKIQEETQTSDNSGFCLIQKDELVKISNSTYKVISFGKKKMILEGVNISEPIKKGKEVKIKSGNFIVESCGKQFLMLRTKAGTIIYDHLLLDQANKRRIEELRNQ